MLALAQARGEVAFSVVPFHCAYTYTQYDTCQALSFAGGICARRCRRDLQSLRADLLAVYLGLRLHPLRQCLAELLPYVQGELYGGEGERVFEQLSLLPYPELRHRGPPRNHCARRRKGQARRRGVIPAVL